MPMKKTNLNNELHQYYSEQLIRYEALEGLVGQIQIAESDSSETLDQIKVILQEIDECDRQNRGLRDQWIAEDVDASPDLKLTVDRVRQLIESMIGQVAKSETKAHDARSELLSRISDASLRRKVAAAYST